MIIQQGHRYSFGVEGSMFVPNSLIASGIRDRGFVDVVVKNRDEVNVGDLPALPPGTTNEWDTVGWATRSTPTADEELPDRVRWLVDLTPAPAAPPPPPVQELPPPPQANTPVPVPPPAPVPLPAGPPMVLVALPAAPRSSLVDLAPAALLGALLLIPYVERFRRELRKRRPR